MGSLNDYYAIRRRLEEVMNETDSTKFDFTAEDEDYGIVGTFLNDTNSSSVDYLDETQSNEGSVIVATLRVYGSMFAVFFVLFLCLRRKYKRYFNVRSWAPKLQCELADDQHGFIRWMWELYFVKDDVILEQCGMDNLCFLRSIYFGVRLSIMGILNATWLMPIYATSGDADEAPSRLVKVSTSYVPSGSNRFYATVLASYILFFYAMYLILNEFKWFTKYRHKFLMQKKPDNYAVYVTGIPEEYRSSFALKEYFRQCFSKEGVLEAHVAMEIPDLNRKVLQRKRLLAKLEHAIALEKLRGITLMHQDVQITTGRSKQRELVDVYEEQLERLNEDIVDAIRKIKFRNDRMQDVFQRSQATRSRLSNEMEDDEEEETDEFTTMDWKAYRDFKLFPLNGPANDSSNIRRRRLPTIESVGSPFSIGSPCSSGDESSLSDFDPNDIETGLHVETDMDLQTDNDVQQDEHAQVNPPTKKEGSELNVGLFQSEPSDRSILTTPADQDDSSAVFANMFFGANLIPTPTESMHRAVESAATSIVEQSQHNEAEPPGASDVPQNAVTISPMRSTEDEPFNSVADACKPVSNDPATLHRNGLGDSTNVNEVSPFVSELEQAVMGISESEVTPGKSGTEGLSSSDMELTKQASQQSGLSSRTGDENGSRRSLRRMSKLPQEVSVRASKVVKDGSGRVRKVVKDSSQTALRASSYVVKEGSEKVKKVVVDGSGQVTKVVKDGSHQVSKVVKDGSQQVTKRISQVNPENLKKATDYGVKGVKMATGAGVTKIVKAKDIGVGNVKNFAHYVLGSGDGTPLDAGFVVFSKLSTTHAALQMIHHPRPFVMDVQEAPMPEDIYWKNVGMPHKAQQIGKLISLGLTGLLCLTWTIPVSFISSLTEVDSLRESVPFIDNMLTKAPWMEVILQQLAPLLLLGLNVFLPVILRFISTFEGHISGSVLEASLFQKVAAFQIIQTFFVSAISGSVWAELSNILKSPGEIINLLARSLPAQSTYFIQIVLVDTVVRLSIELLRVIPLGMAALRRMIGPNLTQKERNTTFLWLHPLSDPWEFQGAEILGEGVLFFVVLFVYAPIAPIMCFFLLFCWLLKGSCYRNQFFYNYGKIPDSGGKMWSSFIGICLCCMLIAQLTVVGMLALKKAPIQSLLMIPLIVITVLFNFYIGMKHFYVTKHLPTRLCLNLDRKHHANGGLDFSFVRNKYLQPALLEREVYSIRSEERHLSPSCDDSASECSHTSKLVSRVRIRV